MCLLHLLHQTGYQVVAAHLDHMIRPSSGEDADLVAKMCETWHIPLILKRMDVRAYCADANLNLEEGARNLRYGFLFDTAMETNSRGVLIAHHADDQVETVLMHFIRGAGLSGLKGMKYRTFLEQFSANIPLIRPLLDFTRTQIETYCSDHDVPFHVDQTNMDTTFFRNRLRHELIPEIERLNPRFREVIRRTTESLQADQDLIHEIVAREWDAIIQETQLEYVKLDPAGLRVCSRGLRWNILRRAIKILRPDLRDFDHAVLIRLDDFITRPGEQKMIDLVGHLEARLDTASLWIVELGYSAPVVRFPQYSEGVQPLNFPLRLKLTNGWYLTGEVLDLKTIEWSSIMHAPENEAWLDQATISGDLSLRNPMPGDRIQPLGGYGHHSKISDLFINHGIPVEARRAYPIICDQDKILWLPGIMISEMSKVTLELKKILHMRLEHV